MLVFPLINDLSRKIIHVDMDAFFAAIEVRDNPELKGKPVVIGADPRLSGGRGVVSTCNYEARAFGIHSAMSSKEAFEFTSSSSCLNISDTSLGFIISLYYLRVLIAISLIHSL